MNTFSIAWRSIRFRGIGSLLSIVSMALGVMLVVAVLSIQAIVSKSFRSNTSFGYDVIVGAKGGPAQLTLNTVFYLSKPTGNIPYEYYLEFQGNEQRRRELQTSIQYLHNQEVIRTRQLSLQQSPWGGGLTEIAMALQNDLLEQQFEQDTNLHRATMFSDYNQLAIPLALGDFLGEPGRYFRVVGTTKEMFTELELNVDKGSKFEFAEGRPLEFYSVENQYFESVLGSQVARDLGLKIGDNIYPIHGDPRTDDSAHVHERAFKIVGILKPTGTPHDRAAFVNLEGFFLMEDHVKPIREQNYLGNPVGEDDETSGQKSDFETIKLKDLLNEDDDAEEDEQANRSFHPQKRFAGQAGYHLPALMAMVSPWEFPIEKKSSSEESLSDQDLDEKIEELIRTDGLEPLPVEQREVTAILVRGNDDMGLAGKMINDLVDSNKLESCLNWSDYRPKKDSVNDAAEAVNPIEEVTILFTYFVNPIRLLLLILTSMICVVSGISILVGIYNSMTQRRHEIAVIRALGARRDNVMMISLVETAMLALAGGFVGWFAGHFLIWTLGGMIESYSGVQVGLFSIAPIELILFPGLLLLALVVGIYPAISAYRTDVAESLGN